MILFTLLDTLWKLSIGAAALVTLIIAITFYFQEGRLRLYLSVFLFALALQAVISVFTAVGTDAELGLWFQLPRTIGWTIVVITGIGVILYQLQILNGKIKR